MPGRSDKRERLIAAGRRLFHRRGIGHSSLADVAEESGVPLGNIYYYFKSKDALIAAVAEDQQNATRGLLEELDEMPEPDRRLLEFIASFEAVRDERAAYGCPVGNLCQETMKAEGGGAPEASAEFETILAWLEGQFVALGFAKRRGWHNAVHILSAIQGASVVAHAFHDSGVVRSEARVMRRWLQNEIAELR